MPCVDFTIGSRAASVHSDVDQAMVSPSERRNENVLAFLVEQQGSGVGLLGQGRRRDGGCMDWLSPLRLRRRCGPGLVPLGGWRLRGSAADRSSQASRSVHHIRGQRGGNGAKRRGGAVHPRVVGGASVFTSADWGCSGPHGADQRSTESRATEDSRPGGASVPTSAESGHAQRCSVELEADGEGLSRGVFAGFILISS
jgi:hypothetical protein